MESDYTRVNMNIRKLIKVARYYGMLMMKAWKILDCIYRIRLLTVIGIGCSNMDIEKLKMDLTTRSNETAVLRDLIDYAEDIILEQCSDYYISQWLNYKENRLELLK